MTGSPAVSHSPAPRSVVETTNDGLTAVLFSALALTPHSRYQEQSERMHIINLATAAANTLRFRAPVFGARSAGDLCPS